MMGLFVSFLAGMVVGLVQLHFGVRAGDVFHPQVVTVFVSMVVLFVVLQSAESRLSQESRWMQVINPLYLLVLGMLIGCAGFLLQLVDAPAALRWGCMLGVAGMVLYGVVAMTLVLSRRSTRC